MTPARPAACYALLHAFWPATMDRLALADFGAAWGPALGRIPEATALAALRRLGETSTFCPSLAEFLAAVRRMGGDLPRTQSECDYPCPTCGRRVRGWTAWVRHEANCAARVAKPATAQDAPGAARAKDATSDAR